MESPDSSAPSTWLARLERWQWLLPVVSFIAGWIGYVAIERGPSVARVMALTVLLSWPWLLLEPLAGRWLHRFSGGWLSPGVVGFVTQSLQQEMLFFSLPFVLGAAQTDVMHGLFVALLVAAALISTLDPVYHRRIANSPTAAVAYQVYCTWVAALVLLPIGLHLPLEHAAPLAAVAGLFALAAGLPRLLESVSGTRASLAAALPVMAALVAVTLIAPALPPAGLRLTESRMTTEISGLRPGAAIQQIDSATLQGNGLVAYSAIHAPTGLRQGLSFDWYHAGKCVDHIPASIEGTGENQRGWRTWTRKQNFDGDPRGSWRVDIRTAGGQLVGRLRFRVT